VRCGYPLDKQPAATNLVMQQVELFAHSAADRRGQGELGFGTKGPLALPNLAVVVDQEQPQALPPQPSLELP
jgi:hypothetical protein